MAHVAFVGLSGTRVRQERLAALGVQLPGLRARLEAIEALPPLGLLTLAAMTPSSWSVSLHEARAVTSKLVDEILETQPSVVAISALTASIVEAYRLADELRRRGVLVVLGGLHVTACPDEASEHADAIVVGDGEAVWAELLADAEGGRLRSAYRAVGRFDLRDAPVPRFDLLGAAERPRFTLQTSRGCPFACDFCAASRLLGPYRRKPAANIAAELRAICAIDPHPHIELADDNTFASGGPHDDVLDALAASNARWFTEADWRLGENPAVLERLASSGCVQVLVGLESLVHQHTGMGAKAKQLDRMMRAVESIQDVGVAVIGCFIVGSDGETMESIAELRSFLASDACADVQVTLLTPFPGTALRRRMLDEGRVLTERDWSYYTLFDVTFRPDSMSVVQLEESYQSLLLDVFDDAQSRRRASLRRSIWKTSERLCT